MNDHESLDSTYALLGIAESHTSHLASHDRCLESVNRTLASVNTILTLHRGRLRDLEEQRIWLIGGMVALSIVVVVLGVTLLAMVVTS